MNEPDTGALPQPSTDAQEHSERLAQLVGSKCELEPAGSLSFAEYMTALLYEPGLGYYMAGSTKFGQDGDFTTAPELSPLFGATLGQQAEEILNQTGGGILELGAGGGKLASGLLNARVGRPIDYTILEPSAELIERQRDWLQHSLTAEQFSKVSWVDTLPENFQGVVIANEVMDALPVERFVVEESIQQVRVDKYLKPRQEPAPQQLTDAVRAIENDIGFALLNGYTSEVCLLLEPWIASLADSLSRGVILLIDYGYPRQEYYSEERQAGTLSCYYRHRAHENPYILPGLQDITAHVDFTGVVEASVKNGLELLGYCSQSSFLLSNGLLDLMNKELDSLTDESARIELSRVVKSLTLPGEMGERFQVMALGKDYDQVLQGFASQDLSYRL